MRRGAWAADPDVLGAASTHGVVRARDLVALGVPERTVYRRCRNGGPWRLLLPGIVLLSNGEPTREQCLLAAVLLGRAGAVITGLDACRRHGVRRGPQGDGKIHLLVPHSRQIRSVGFVHVERSERMPEIVRRSGLPFAPPTRACVDAARRIRSPAEVTELFSDAVQRGICDVRALVEEVTQCGRRGSAVPRSVLVDVGEGVRSTAERDAKRLVAGSGLPTPWWNARIHDAEGRLLGVADCWWDEVAMVWEIESTEWHLRPVDHDRSVARAARFAAAGALYIPTKPKMLRGDPAGVRSVLRRGHDQALARPRPPLRAVPVS